jgi:hypothetical protein
MKIHQKLSKIKSILEHDNEDGNPPEPPKALGQKLSNAAVKAIMAGFGKPDWVAYMSLFADNDAQLKRLTVIQEDDPSYLPLIRAYIVSNAVCDIGTNNSTAQNVRTEVDDGLSDAPDGTVTARRPFIIPGLE